MSEINLLALQLSKMYNWEEVGGALISKENESAGRCVDASIKI